MQQTFNELADALVGEVRGDEVLLLNFSGEDSDFARLNHSAIRQAGSVAQRYLSVELIDGRRHLTSTYTLSGEPEADGGRGRAMVAELRQKLPHVPEDPHLLYATDVQSGESTGENRLPDRAEAISAALAAGQGRDMVGLLAMGGIHAGFANSLGQRNWFSAHTFDLSWSFYHAADKAVKSSYAGFGWDQAAFARKVDAAAEQLAILRRPAKTIEAGEYRVYLAPAAMLELLEMLCWGGFGLKAHRTKSTCLLRMVEDGATLDPSVTLRENTAEGMTANFGAKGFVKPDEVTLIEGGRFANCLVSPRSAKEYGVEPNGACGGEWPESMDVSAGEVATADVLGRLDTGIYVNQLWYLNFSDRPACRITGMTRFATFWVEGGRIVAPLNVMRFDETAYRVLGENLIGLTAERDFIPNSQTYGSRTTESCRLPGALVEGFRFTL